MRYVVMAVAVAALAGCGGVKTVSVEGKVVWADGTPAKELAGGLVMFQSADAKARGRGVIGPDGSFKLEAEGGAGGIPAGEYQVWVSENRPVVRETPEGEELAPPKMELKFGDPKTSGLGQKIDSSGEVVLKVNRAGKKR